MTLDEAWAEAEAALPDGWKIARLEEGWGNPWRARAVLFVNGPIKTFSDCEADGPTPAAALTALAAKLRGVAG